MLASKHKLFVIFFQLIEVLQRKRISTMMNNEARIELALGFARSDGEKLFHLSSYDPMTPFPTFQVYVYVMLYN